MKTTVLSLTAFLAIALASAAFAYDRCDEAINNPSNLAQQLRSAALARTPVKYFEVARSIELLTQPFNKESFIPFATEQQGRKIIVVPAQFVLVVCKLAIAEYFEIKTSQQSTFDRAAGIAAKCLDDGGSRSTCLVGFANDLASQYQKSFASLPAGEQRFAFSLYEAAILQIVMHEYGHHLLNHVNRIKAQQLARIDAEFEADLFAVLNGVQVGEPSSAMYYVFRPLSDVEGHTSKLATNDYESSACRASNVENITGFTGIAPVVLVDASFGGGYSLQKDSPALFRSMGQKQFSGGTPSLRPGSCGRIAKVALGTTYEELRRMYLRMEADVDLLFAAGNQVDTARMVRLLNDLSGMAANFQYLDSTAAKSMALILRRWGLRGRPLTPLLPSTDRFLSSPAVAGNFMSDDLGRILQAQGLAVLQERTNLAVQPRLEQAYALLQRAVVYNPAQTEAWENLAFIAFKRGDCAAAAGFAEKSIATYTGAKKDDVEGTRFFADAMKKMSADPRTCAAEGAKFHPYPGL